MICRSYKEGIIFKNQNSAFDLKLPRTLIKVTMQWFIYIQEGGLQRAIHMLTNNFFEIQSLITMSISLKSGVAWEL
jgi:hypothetical protein